MDDAFKDVRFRNVPKRTRKIIKLMKLELSTEKPEESFNQTDALAFIVDEFEKQKNKASDKTK